MRTRRKLLLALGTFVFALVGAALVGELALRRMSTAAKGGQ